MSPTPGPDALDDAIDEVLSASLDGELDLDPSSDGLRVAVARALGRPVDELPTEGALHRRVEALEAARAAFAVEPLDELTRRRLVRAALDASAVAGSPRAEPAEGSAAGVVAAPAGADRAALARQRRVGALGMVAALVLIVMGVVAVRSGSGPDDDATTNVAVADGTGTPATAGPERAAASDRAAMADLGDVSTPEALTLAVQARLGGPAAMSSGVAAGPGPSTVTTAAPDAEPPPDTPSPEGDARADSVWLQDTGSAAVACLPAGVRGDDPVVLGPARSGGVEVVVVVTTGPAGAPTGTGGTATRPEADGDVPAPVLAHVVDPAACEVLATREVPLGG